MSLHLSKYHIVGNHMSWLNYVMGTQKNCLILTCVLSRNNLNMLQHLNYKRSVQKENDLQGTKIFQYCTGPAGRVTYNFHSSCKHIYMSFKSVCNTENKVVICNMTSWSNSSYRTSALGRITCPF